MLTTAKTFLSSSFKKLPFSAPVANYAFSQRYDQGRGTGMNNDQFQDAQQQQQSYAKPTGPTADELVSQDKNLNSFLGRVYKTTGLSVGSYLLGGYFLASTPIVFNPGLCVIGGLVSSIAGIYYFNKIPPVITQEKGPRGQMVEKWVNPSNRKFAFASIITGSTVATAPFMGYLAMASPGTIPVAAGSALMVMGGASLYAMKKPIGQFKLWESTLTGGLFALIGMNIASLVTGMIIGPNAFSYACHQIDLYAGLALFSAFQAYDTHLAIEDYQQGSNDHLQHTINFFLNFINLFRRIAEILMRARD